MTCSCPADPVSEITITYVYGSDAPYASFVSLHVTDGRWALTNVVVVVLKKNQNVHLDLLSNLQSGGKKMLIHTYCPCN